jgi:hypothetical protein
LPDKLRFAQPPILGCPGQTSARSGDLQKAVGQRSFDTLDGRSAYQRTYETGINYREGVLEWFISYRTICGVSYLEVLASAHPEHNGFLKSASRGLNKQLTSLHDIANLNHVSTKSFIKSPKEALNTSISKNHPGDFWH